jgi:hypothetical protein
MKIIYFLLYTTIVKCFIIRKFVKYIFQKIRRRKQFENNHKFPQKQKYEHEEIFQDDGKQTIISKYENLNWQLICEIISLLPYRLHKITLFDIDYLVWRDKKNILYYSMLYSNESSVENNYFHGKLYIV